MDLIMKLSVLRSIFCNIECKKKTDKICQEQLDQMKKLDVCLTL